MKPIKQKYFFRTLPKDYGTYDLMFVDNDGNEIATAKKGDDKSKPFTITPLFSVSDTEQNIIQKATKLGYKHYGQYSVEELDSLSISDERKLIEYFLIQKWLRDKKEYSVDIRYYVLREKVYESVIRRNESGEIIAFGLNSQYRFDTYEEALEMGILVVLEKMKL